MKKLLFILFAVTALSTAFVISGCDSTTTEEVGKSAIYGTLTDLNGNPIPEAIVSTSPSSMVDTTDNLGQFLLTKIKKGTYYVIFQKPGSNFRKDSVQKVVGLQDSLLVNFTMNRADVLVYRDIIVDEYFNDFSLSGVDCWEGRSVQELDNAHKDIQLRDSVGMGINFYFRSGHIALNKRLAGFRTYISDTIANCTTAEWDTLSKIWNIAGDPQPFDFLYDQCNYYFSEPLPNKRPVYSFYLEGRKASNPNFNGGVNVYGMFFIKNFYRNTSTGKMQAVIDIKLNLKAQNWFRQN